MPLDYEGFIKKNTTFGINLQTYIVGLVLSLQNMCSSMKMLAALFSNY